MERYSMSRLLSNVLSRVMAVPATVIYFTCYDQLCALLRVRMEDYAQEAPLIAGAIARGEETAVQSPNQDGDLLLCDRQCSCNS